MPSTILAGGQHFLQHTAAFREPDDLSTLRIFFPQACSWPRKYLHRCSLLKWAKLSPGDAMDKMQRQHCAMQYRHIALFPVGEMVAQLTVKWPFAYS